MDCRLLTLRVHIISLLLFDTHWIAPWLAALIQRVLFRSKLALVTQNFGQTFVLSLRWIVAQWAIWVTLWNQIDAVNSPRFLEVTEIGFQLKVLKWAATFFGFDDRGLIQGQLKSQLLLSILPADDLFDFHVRSLRFIRRDDLRCLLASAQIGIGFSFEYFLFLFEFLLHFSGLGSYYVARTWWVHFEFISHGRGHHRVFLNHNRKCARLMLVLNWFLMIAFAVASTDPFEALLFFLGRGPAFIRS